VTAIDLLTENAADIRHLEQGRDALYQERRDLTVRARAEGASWDHIEQATGVRRQTITRQSKGTTR
jgi:hypothetical protein